MTISSWETPSNEHLTIQLVYKSTTSSVVKSIRMIRMTSKNQEGTKFMIRPYFICDLFHNDMTKVGLWIITIICISF